MDTAGISATQNDAVDSKYGKKLAYEKNLKAPIWRKRSCTDVPCLLLFLVFLAGWISIASYAWLNGDLNKLVVPTDSFNRKCGIESGVLNKNYLFFFNLDKCIDPLTPLTGCPTPQICIEKCPQESFIWDRMKDQLTLEELRSKLICITEGDKRNIRSKQDAQNAIDNERCAKWYFKSAPLLNRCMWELSPEVCEYIPTFLLSRNKRDLLGFQSNVSNIQSEEQLRAFALTMYPFQEISDKAIKLDSKLEQADKSNTLCSIRQNLGQTVIKEKMLQADSKLAKLIANIVNHFTNGTHEAQRIGENIVEDILNSYIVVLIAILCTLVASLIFISLMRWLASPILWISICGVFVGLIVGIYYSINNYLFFHREATVPQHALNLNAAVKNILQDERLWFYLSIFLCICFVVMLLFILVMRKRISIAVAVIKEGSKAVSSVKSAIFFPIITWFLFVLAIIYAAAVGLHLGSIGTNSFRMIRQLDPNSITGVTQENCKCDGPAENYTLGGTCDPQTFEDYCYNADIPVLNKFSEKSPCTKTSCSFLEIQHSTLIKCYTVYNIFGYLWLTFFINGFSEMVLACTFATWYWTFKKKDLPFFTLSKAICQTLFYHLGTIAFGSLLLAICRFIRLILEYIDRKLKKYDNAVTKAILCCMRCFFWILESFLRFLSANAYIMCAIHGKNFCTSAKDAFNLIMRNVLRAVALDKVTDFLFLMSKLLITGGAGVATYFFLLNNPSIIQIHYLAVPTTVVALCTFLITSFFFSVYSIAVDTLFLCFLEDIERNDGSPQKPYYMSKNLMKILGKRNKIRARTE